MYNSFSECYSALLQNEELDVARGGQVIKTIDGFNYRLHGQPDIDGEILLEINPSSTPEVTWRVSYGSEGARQAYRAQVFSG